MKKPSFCLLVAAWMFVLVSGRSSSIRKEEAQEDDIYFEGEHDPNDRQPEVSDEDLPKNGELFEGDMVMDNDIRRFVLGLNKKRSAVSLSDEGKRKHWKDGIVPYVFDRRILPRIKRRIKEAIRVLNHFTCVRYIPKRQNDKDYVSFTSKGRGCSSSVGKVGGKQMIHLSAGCSRIGTVLHEMMHAIGIIHEQSRPDRNKHLKVVFENIKSRLVHNFRMYEWYNTDNLGVTYNFYSVMHYSNYAFSKNGEKTLISKQDENLKFGQRKQLSSSDVKEINRLYNCKNVKYDESDLLHDMTDADVEREKRDREEEEEREEEFFKNIYA